MTLVVAVMDAMGVGTGAAAAVFARAFEAAPPLSPATVDGIEADPRVEAMIESALPLAPVDPAPPEPHPTCNVSNAKAKTATKIEKGARTSLSLGMVNRETLTIRQ